MIKIRFPFIVGLVCSGVLLLAGCRDGAQDGQTAIRMDVERTGKPFVDAVLSVEMIPLEADDAHLLGSRIGFCLLDDSYLLFDRQNIKIFRYSLDGRFLNEVGRRGNGPGEYLSLRSVQVLDGRIHVFSLPDTEQVYSPEGALLEQKTGVPVSFGAFRLETGLLTYYGYSGQKPHRVVFTEDGTGSESGFLDVDAKLLSLDLGNDPFGALPGGGVSILDSYSPVVYQYADNEVRPYLVFDFGKYAIKPAFYEADDAFKSAEYLMASDYAVIVRFMEGSRHRLVQVSLSDQSTGQGECRYGMDDGKKWVWFSLSDYGLDDPAPFHCFDGDILYGVFTAGDLLSMKGALKGKIADANILDSLDDTDTYVLAKIHLR